MWRFNFQVIKNKNFQLVCKLHVTVELELTQSVNGFRNRGMNFDHDSTRFQCNNSHRGIILTVDPQAISPKWTLQFGNFLIVQFPFDVEVGQSGCKGIGILVFLI